MADSSRRESDHWADDNEGAHNGFIEVFPFPVASPEDGTTGLISRVSASCYRRLFAAVLVLLVEPELKDEPIFIVVMIVNV